MNKPGTFPSVGIDLTDLNRWQKPHRAELFTESEQDYIATQTDPTVAMAKLWAMREATLKALYPHLPHLTLRSLAILPRQTDPNSFTAISVTGLDSAWTQLIELDITVMEKTVIAVALLPQAPVLKLLSSVPPSPLS